MQPSVVEKLAGTVVRYFGQTPTPDTTRMLYLQGIDRVRPGGVRFSYDLTAIVPEVHFVEEGDPIGPPIFEHLDEESRMTVRVVPAERRAAICSDVAQGYALLAEYDKALPNVLSTLVGSYAAVECPKIGGASFADLMGVVLLSAPKWWSVVNYADSILHEGVHQSLFLVEMVCGLFTRPHPEMERDESTFVLSSIKRIRRPYSLSFHAAAVSYTLVGLYSWLGQTDEAEMLRNNLIPTLEELVRLDHMLNATGREILDEMTRGVKG
jgi:hypothetical protein